jgi:p-aminobenzoyl-glutamate transporter AbgT
LGVALALHGASLDFLSLLSDDGPKGLVKPRLHLIRRNKKKSPISPQEKKKTKRKIQNNKKKRSHQKKKLMFLLHLVLFLFFLVAQKAIEYHHHRVGDLIMWPATIRFLHLLLFLLFGSNSRVFLLTRNRGSHYR